MTHSSGAVPAAMTARVTRAGELASLRRLVADAAGSAGLTPDRAARLVLAVDEIATNALVHGLPPATVTITVNAGSIVVAVHDRGRAFATSDGSTIAVRPAAPDAVRGRGLWLADRMADLLSLTADAHGTTVTVSMVIAS